MPRNRSLAALLAVAVLISAAGYLALRPETLEGTVNHKAISETRDSTSYTIMRMTDTGTIVKDSEFEGDFEASAAVDDALANKLDSRYDEVRYIVSVRTSEGAMAYFVSREDFNKAEVGDRIKFEILRFKTTTIRITQILG
jgi:hypothetical protein